MLSQNYFGKMSMNPRPLPPAHKNQLFVPVKSIGFFNDQHPPTVNFFRNHEIGRKKLRVPAPSGLKIPHENDDDKETTSSNDSMTSMIHIRGRASVTDVTKSVKVADVTRKSQSLEGDDAKLVSFLTEDPSSYRSYDGRSPAFSPVLECSKYNIIGEPKFRKKRFQRNVWTLPKIVPRRGFMEPDDADHPKTNSIDLRSIYGTKSKVQQVTYETFNFFFK